MSTPREILREADRARSNAEHAAEVVKLSHPNVRLGISVGNFALRPEAVAVMRKALEEWGTEQAERADFLEARVTVR